MTQTELLQRIKERLQSLYGERFRGLVLYGSVARGEALDQGLLGNTVGGALGFGF